jgi:type I restriction enzyme S subunit
MNNWPRRRLKDLGEWFGGATPSKRRADFWTGGTIPWLSPKDMGPQVLHSTQDYITTMAVDQSATRMVPAGSVAIVVRSGILERTLPIAVVPFETTLNQDMKALVPSADVDPRWVAWGLRAFERQLLRTCRKAGTTVASIEIPRLYDFEMPVPDSDEQRRIIDVLEDHLSRLDAAADELATASTRSRLMHKSILTSLIPDLDEYPAHWKVATVAEAGKVELGRQRHPDWHHGPNMRPYLRVANVFEDRIDVTDVKEMHWPHDTFERFRLAPGDVLLNEGQSPEFLGRPALYQGEPPDIAFTNSLLRFQAYEHVLPEFALLVFRRHMHAGRFAREARITTNIAHLSAARLKPIEFPIPPLDEQRRLVEIGKDEFDGMERLGQQISTTYIQSRALRQCLLAATFSGRLTERSSVLDRIEEAADVGAS